MLGVVDCLEAITVQYTTEDLRALWEFCQHDFERLLGLLEWLETLPHPSRSEQVEGAHFIYRAKATGLATPQSSHAPDALPRAPLP